MKVKKSSSKANYAAKNAPLFCEIYFIYKGRHAWTREASEGPKPLPSFSKPVITTAETVRSESFHCSRNNAIHPESLRSVSARSTLFTESSDWVQGDTKHVEVASLPALSHSSHNLQSSFCQTTTVTGSENSSAERMMSSTSEPKVEEEGLYSQLTEARIEAEASRNEVLVEIMNRKNLESEAIETISKVSMGLIPIVQSRNLFFTIMAPRN